MQDLELLHFYTTVTCFTLTDKPERQHVWQHVIPKIAFSHHFLLYGILSISALHLSHLASERRDSLVVDASTYHTTALPMFLSALSNISSQNCNACSAFATLLVVYKWASCSDTDHLFFGDTPAEVEADTMEWVQLLRGAGTVISNYYQEIMQGPLRAILQWDNTAELAAETSPEDSARFTCLEQLWDISPTPFTSDEVDALKEALRWLKITYTMMTRPTDRADSASDALSWPIRIPDLFLLMVQQRQPAALVVLVHYCLLLNRVGDFWWIRGMSRHLLQKIHGAVGKEWESWITWPLQDLVLCEFRNHHSQTKV